MISELLICCPAFSGLSVRRSAVRGICDLVIVIGMMVASISQVAHADFVVISDFTSQYVFSTTTDPKKWTWLPPPSNDRVLDIIAPFDLSREFLREESITGKNIAGATKMRLRASWIPNEPTSGGNFTIKLQGGGGVTFATADFSFAEFAAPGSPYITIEKSLNWVTNPTTTQVEQWDLSATSFTGSGGDMYFQEMGASDNASVPEPSSLILFGLGATGVAWRARRKRRA